MHPFLVELQLGSFTFKLPSYGVFLALGFSLAYFYCLKLALKFKVPPVHFERLFVIVVLASMVGARMFHVFFEDWAYYRLHPLRAFALWEGGYTLYGALLLGMLCFYLYTKWTRAPFFKLIDITTVGSALGIGIGRIGCLLAGCCWGKPTSLAWGVKLDGKGSFCNLPHVSLHPSQLYESLGCFLLFLWLRGRIHKTHFPGQIFVEGLMGYNLVRFGVEFFRGDAYRGHLSGSWVSYSQFISLCMFPLALTGWYYLKKRAHKSLSSPPTP